MSQGFPQRDVEFLGQWVGSAWGGTRGFCFPLPRQRWEVRAPHHHSPVAPGRGGSSSSLLALGDFLLRPVQSWGWQSPGSGAALRGQTLTQTGLGYAPGCASHSQGLPASCVGSVGSPDELTPSWGRVWRCWAARTTPLPGWHGAPKPPPRVSMEEQLCKDPRAVPPWLSCSF